MKVVINSYIVVAHTSELHGINFIGWGTDKVLFPEVAAYTVITG